MLEVAGDSSRGGDWALVRLTVDALKKSLLTPNTAVAQ